MVVIYRELSVWIISIVADETAKTLVGPNDIVLFLGKPVEALQLVSPSSALSPIGIFLVKPLGSFFVLASGAYTSDGFRPLPDGIHFVAFRTFNVIAFIWSPTHRGNVGLDRDSFKWYTCDENWRRR